MVDGKAEIGGQLFQQHHFLKPECVRFVAIDIECSHHLPADPQRRGGRRPVTLGARMLPPQRESLVDFGIVVDHRGAHTDCGAGRAPPLWRVVAANLRPGGIVPGKAGLGHRTHRHTVLIHQADPGHAEQVAPDQFLADAQHQRLVGQSRHEHFVDRRNRLQEQIAPLHDPRQRLGLFTLSCVRRAAGLLRFLQRAGVKPLRQQGFGSAATRSRLVERNLRIHPQRQGLALAIEAVVQPPVARTVLPQQQIHAATVRQLDRFVGRPCLADTAIGERGRNTGHDGGVWVSE